MFGVFHCRDLLRWLFTSGDPTVTGATLAGPTALGPLVAPNMISGFYVSLHTAYPGPSGTQTTSEVTTGQYQNYVRLGIGRAAAPSHNWVAVTPDMLNTVNLDWPIAGAASAGCTITHVGIGRSVSGAGVLYASGPLITFVSHVAPGLAYVTKTGTSHEVTRKDALFINPTRIRVYQHHDEPLPGGLTEGTLYYGKNLPSENNLYRIYTDAAATIPVNITTKRALIDVRSYDVTIPAGGGNVFVHMGASAQIGNTGMFMSFGGAS
jgi:hypothetical protein